MIYKNSFIHHLSLAGLTTAMVFSQAFEKTIKQLQLVQDVDGRVLRNTKITDHRETVDHFLISV